MKKKRNRKGTVRSTRGIGIDTKHKGMQQIEDHPTKEGDGWRIISLTFNEEAQRAKNYCETFSLSLILACVEILLAQWVFCCNTIPT
jgi:hypothetical protein